MDTVQEEGEVDEYMSKAINKQKFEIFNDIYDNAEKEHDMVIISHSKSDWIAMNSCEFHSHEDSVNLPTLNRLETA